MEKIAPLCHSPLILTSGKDCQLGHANTMVSTQGWPEEEMTYSGNHVLDKKPLFRTPFIWGMSNKVWVQRQEWKYTFLAAGKK